MTKRTFRVAIIALLMLSSFASSYAASEFDATEWLGVQTLIDFNLFEPRLLFRPGLEDVNLPFSQRILNGTYLLEDQRDSSIAQHPVYLSPSYRVTVAEMQLDKWRVELNPSAKTVGNRINSYCKKVFLYVDANGNLDPARRNWPQPRDKDQKLLQSPLIVAATDATATQGDIKVPFPKLVASTDGSYTVDESKVETVTKDNFRTVLGARIHFPEHWFNAWAKVKPPFELSAYQLPRRGVYGNERYLGIVGGEVRNVNNGVLYNVGDIKWIRAKIHGRNFNHGLAIRLKDQNEQVREYFLGYLYYAGPQVKEWNNPDYIESIDHREAFRLPLYPKEIPFKKFDSFIVYRQGEFTGGDFVIYFEKVWINYDLAFSPFVLEQVQFSDENVWKILTNESFKAAEEDGKKRAEEIDLRRQTEGVLSNYTDKQWPEAQKR